MVKLNPMFKAHQGCTGRGLVFLSMAMVYAEVPRNRTHRKLVTFEFRSSFN